MSYYLAYNPALGNSLVALSETPIAQSEGLIYKSYSGDMPDLSKMVWNTAMLNFYVKPRRRLTKLEWMNRFTDAELVAIYDAAKVSTAIEVWLAKFNNTTAEADGTAIDTDDPRTIGGLMVLEGAGLLAPGRAAEIGGT